MRPRPYTEAFIDVKAERERERRDNEKKEEEEKEKEDRRARRLHKPRGEKMRNSISTCRSPSLSMLSVRRRTSLGEDLFILSLCSLFDISHLFKENSGGRQMRSTQRDRLKKRKRRMTQQASSLLLLHLAWSSTSSTGARLFFLLLPSTSSIQNSSSSSLSFIFSP